MTCLVPYRRWVASLLLYFLPFVSAHAQGPTTIELKQASVVVDSKEIPKELLIVFEINSGLVVDRATLFSRRSGSREYHQRTLRLTSQLFYEGSISYSPKTEYFVTVIAEKGEKSEFGSETNPKILEAEDLERARETGNSKRHWVAFTALAIVVGVLAALVGLREAAPRKKK